MKEEVYKFAGQSMERRGQEISYDVQEITVRYQQVDRLLQSVREGNEYQACLVMRERRALGVAGRLKDNLTEYKFDLVLLSGLMGQALRESGVEDLHLDRVYTEGISRIEQAQSMEECGVIAEEVARKYCELNRLKSFGNYSPLVKRIILAVDMDLSQPLTLNYFAERLNVNGSYLSNLFKKETGIPVTEYVTSRRIRHAANLLLTSQMPIKTVAKQVGITDVQYFSRIFKKRIGQTPRQYRESRKENTSEGGRE
ncbi:MAG: helix-turn-helix transcriptional regulator [Lachnospiraceae bacterium]|nr:helix-turn-helix transcriptional regulator [Lachnospiraceae bacterium]